MKIRYIAAILSLFTSSMIIATEVGYFPGRPKLIEMADAIVILRVERPLSEFDTPTLYTTYECFIYQTLKGDIPKDSYIKLQLYNLDSFASPYPHGSTHLIFLIKKVTENEPTDFRMLTTFGAQTLLSPFGHEKEPEGNTIEEQVKNLVKDAIDYQTKEHEKRMKFLKSIINQPVKSEKSSKKDILNNVFSEEVLTHAFESGRALLVVRVSSVREEKNKNNTIFYYYQTHVLRSIIDGDHITENFNDPLELFAGASYGKTLTPGSVYALFIIQYAPHHFSWAHRDALLKVDSAEGRSVNDLSKKAAEVYEATSIFEFRNPVVVENLLPELPEQLILQCEQFRRNRDRRTEYARAIAESDIASKPKYQLSSGLTPSSRAEYEKPIVPLTRSQVIKLLGEPTLKSGRIYLWYCGKDRNYDLPGDWAGVLSVTFDYDCYVNVFRYQTQEEWKWRKD